MRQQPTRRALCAASVLVALALRALRQLMLPGARVFAPLEHFVSAEL